MDISIPERTDESSQRWNFVWTADGDVQFDDTEAHEVVTSILESKAGYWADRNHGSELDQIGDITRRTPSQAEAMALDALDAVVQVGEVVAPSVSATTSAQIGRLELDVAWKTPSGEDERRKVSL